MSWKDSFPKQNRYFETENGILYCGDCLEIIKNFPEESVDLIVTSPPYNKGYWSKNRNPDNGFKTKSRRIKYGDFDDNVEPDKYVYFQKQILKQMIRVVKQTGSIFYNHTDILREHQTIHPLYVYDFPLKQIIIWSKSNTPKLDKSYFFPVFEYIFWIQKYRWARTKFDRKKAKYQTNIWKFQPDKSNPHPAPFPLELPENCILATTEEQDIVLDPFMGSGTTAVASERLGRCWIGIEKIKEYCEMAKNRIQELNGRLFNG